MSRLSLSRRDSFFPKTTERVLFAAGPTAANLVTACVAVVESIAMDQGKDGTRRPATSLTVRAAYPPAGPLLHPDALPPLQTSFPSCSFVLSSKLSNISDRAFTAHGPVPDLKLALKSVVGELQHDAYSRMEADYQSLEAPPDRAEQRQRHRSAEKRKRRAEEQEREQTARDKASAKRRRGQDDPLKPSARKSRPSGGKSRRR